MNYPNVEHIRSEPRMTREQTEDHYYAQRDADVAAAYQMAINEACHAIRMIPMDAVTPEVISQLLSTIACAAVVARLDEVAESLEILAMEIEP